MHPAAEAQLFLGKSHIIMRSRVLNGIVIGKVSLQDHLTRRIPAAGTPCHLRDQLKRALGSAKIGEAESDIRAHDPDQRYPMNIVALGDHLRANQNVDFAAMQSAQHALEVIAPANRIAIEPLDARARKQAMQKFFQFFAAGSDKEDVFASAIGASARDATAKSAIV